MKFLLRRNFPEIKAAKLADSDKAKQTVKTFHKNVTINKEHRKSGPGADYGSLIILERSEVAQG